MKLTMEAAKDLAARAIRHRTLNGILGHLQLYKGPQAIVPGFVNVQVDGECIYLPVEAIEDAVRKEINKIENELAMQGIELAEEQHINRL